MRRARRLAILTVAVSVVLGVLAVPAGAAVVGCIPRDATAVLRLRNLEGHYRDLRESDLYARMTDATFMPELAAGLAQARKQFDQFEAETGIDLEEVLLDVLGQDCAIFVLGEGKGTFVAEARSQDAVEKAVETMLQIERSEGKLQGSTEESYRGVVLYRDVMLGKVRYRAQIGRVLAMADNDREGVCGVIDVRKGAPAITASASYRAAARLVPVEAVVALYVDGALLRTLVEKMPAPDPGARAIGRRLGATLGKARFAIVSVLADGEAKLRATLAYEGGALPDEVRAMIPETASGLDILRVAPRDTIFAAARGLNAGGVWNAVLEGAEAQSPAAARRLKGALDLVIGMTGGVYSAEQLWDEIGDQGALFVLPAPEEGGLPGLVIAVALEKTEHIPLAIESVTGGVVGFTRADGNENVSLHQEPYNGANLTTVRIERPGEAIEEFNPTFGLVGSNWILASSREAAMRMVDASRAKAGPSFSRLAGTNYAGSVLNVGALLKTVKRYEEVLVRRAVEEEGKTEEKARGDLVALEKLLSLLDRVECAAAYKDGRTTLQMTVRLAH
ncbi:MAG: hypothetical protein J7M08_08790 [Planctomycetes bacterium]|nr:hypothetical protein [Planctomycetota bacterium]